tara:strand:- start:973 stop:1272 length:300 start_codon:yes stop_codon:yes gene_type:complete
MKKLAFILFISLFIQSMQAQTKVTKNQTIHLDNKATIEVEYYSKYSVLTLCVNNDCIPTLVRTPYRLKTKLDRIELNNKTNRLLNLLIKNYQHSLTQGR